MALVPMPIELGDEIAFDEPHATSELPGNASPGLFAVLCTPAGSLFSDDASNARFLTRVIAAAETDVPAGTYALMLTGLRRGGTAGERGRLDHGRVTSSCAAL